MFPQSTKKDNYVIAGIIKHTYEIVVASMDTDKNVTIQIIIDIVV